MLSRDENVPSAARDAEASGNIFGVDQQDRWI